MRLNADEIGTIRNVIGRYDPSAAVWLFGSRVDDAKKGGDIDLAILSDRIAWCERMHIRSDITSALGEQHIDLIVSRDGNEPFFRLALENGERLT